MFFLQIKRALCCLSVTSSYYTVFCKHWTISTIKSHNFVLVPVVYNFIERQQSFKLVTVLWSKIIYLRKLIASIVVLIMITKLSENRVLSGYHKYWQMLKVWHTYILYEIRGHNCKLANGAKSITTCNERWWVNFTTSVCPVLF